MCCLFFDTETTGLPNDDSAPTTDTDNWPRMVQLAWVRVSPDTQEIGDVKSRIVSPDGFRIPSSAESVHGISTRRAVEEGTPLGDVLEAFLGAVSSSDTLVGHKVDFDRSVVGAELVRQRGQDTLEDVPTICTMKQTEVFCGKSNYYGYRYPSLQELHQTLFDCEFDDAHDAGADVRAGARCFLELLERDVIDHISGHEPATDQALSSSPSENPSPDIAPPPNESPF